MTIITDLITKKPLDQALRSRAKQVIPGGMYGHMSANLLPDGFPQFYRSGEGVRLHDVDGNEYLDFMCAFGPMISGYRNPVVDAAAAKQQLEGDTLGGPSPRMVELAELLTTTITHADWAMFAKNGTDATSLAVTIARAETGKEILLKGSTAYHGANAWFNPNRLGATDADSANIIEYVFNDIASLRQAADQAEGNIAAIIISPFKHDAPDDQVEVEVAFAQQARALADKIGAVLIMDEVRTGFRLSSTGAWDSIGVLPDLTAFSKAIANGYPISAVVGTDSLREAASKIFATGSFWYSSVPMAAAIANITQLTATDSPALMDNVGQLLRTGLQRQADSYGIGIVQTGPAVMPFLRFVDDREFGMALAFTNAAVKRGVLLHPVHNWFLSTAHTAEDVANALEKTDEAFAEVKKLFG